MREQMRQAAAGSDPDGAVAILVESLAVAIVPYQAIVFGEAAPHVAIEDLDALVFAYPGPIVPVGAEEENLIRSEGGAI